jgi:hypothetical protein
MKIWQAENEISMPGYSIVEGLVYNIIAMTPDHELNPFERLYVALGSGRACHAGYLTDTYMACGCFEKAQEYYESTRHHRKLGDLAWILGDHVAAEDHYRTTSNGAQSYRTEPDYDRLIRLAFVQEEWAEVIHRFTETGFSSGFSDGQVCCGGSCVSGRPLLEMLAVAQVASGTEPSADVLADLAESFGLSDQDWKDFVSDGDYGQRKTIDKIKRRCPPRFGKHPPTSVERARASGATARSQRVLDYIRRGDEVVTAAQDHLVSFGHDGDERDLIDFVDLVTGSGVTSVSHSVLFAAMGHDSFNPASAPPDRLIRLYGSHPAMNKRYFGRLLQLKFEHGYDLSGSEIVTGLFQKMASIEEILRPSPAKDDFDFRKLAQFRDWAELRLDDWIRSAGAEPAKFVAETWRVGAAVGVHPPFGSTAIKRPETPRDMNEWKDLLGQAARWLRQAWDEEIGKSQWVSENQLFQLLRRHLKSFRVEQHARPVWIEPQHLDVYIPDVSIAVEFMGEQHYRPIDFFGGRAGFVEVQLRDRRKQQLCSSNGVELVYVRFDEDIPTRALEIAEQVNQKINKA